MKTKHFLTMAALSLMVAAIFTSCDGALDDIFGEWDKPSGGTVTPSGGDGGGSGSSSDEGGGSSSTPTGIAYIAWNGTALADADPLAEGTYTEVTGSTTDISWDAGKYVVKNSVTIDGTVTLNGDVDLILCDGVTLTINKQIKKASGTLTLNIYGQTGQTGTLNVTDPDNNNGAIRSVDNINIHGGKITASTSNGGYAIVASTTINVYGGILNATGQSTSVYGGGFSLSTPCEINIYGGSVTATAACTTTGNAIGCGNNGKINMYGGKIYASSTGTKVLYGMKVYTKDGFTGSIYTSTNGADWTPTASPLDADSYTNKYMKAE